MKMLTPWTLGEPLNHWSDTYEEATIYNAKGNEVCSLEGCGRGMKEKAEFILEAANSHDPLVRVANAARKLEPILIKARKKFLEKVEEITNLDGEMAKELKRETADLVDVLLAALKAAGGEV